MPPPASTKPFYIRIKRGKTDVFLEMKDINTIIDIKQKVIAIINSEKSVDDVALSVESSTDKGAFHRLDDKGTISALGFENGQVLYLTFRNHDEWEKEHMDEYEPIDDESYEEPEASKKDEKGKGKERSRVA